MHVKSQKMRDRLFKYLDRSSFSVKDGLPWGEGSFPLGIIEEKEAPRQRSIGLSNHLCEPEYLPWEIVP